MADWRLVLGIVFLALLVGAVAYGTALQRGQAPTTVCSPDLSKPHLAIRAVEAPNATHGGYAFWVVNPTDGPITFWGGQYTIRTLDVLPDGHLRERPTTMNTNIDFVEGYEGTTVPPRGEERWGAGDLPGAAEYVLEAKMDGMCGSARLRGR